MAINKQMIPCALNLIKLGVMGVNVPCTSYSSLCNNPVSFCSLYNLSPLNKCYFLVWVLNLFVFPSVLMEKALCTFLWLPVGQRQHSAVPDGNGLTWVSSSAVLSSHLAWENKWWLSSLFLVRIIIWCLLKSLPQGMSDKYYLEFLMAVLRGHAYCWRLKPTVGISWEVLENVLVAVAEDRFKLVDMYVLGSTNSRGKNKSWIFLLVYLWFN